MVGQAAQGAGKRDQLMIAAFEGWNDAGEAASTTIDHLRRHWEAKLIAEFDPERYHDFQVTRPLMRISDGKRALTWQTTRVYQAYPPNRSPVVLVHGIEPSMRWPTYMRELLDIASENHTDLLITMGALLSDVPHTRPIPVMGTSENAQIRERFSVEQSTYEGVTGIIGALQDAAVAEGLPGLSLWASVPHYVSQPPSPKATISLIAKIQSIVDVDIPLDDLPEAAIAWEKQVNELTDDDSDIGAYIRQLEEAKDTADSPEASGEAIAREFEKYLRRDDKGDQPPAPKS